MYQKIFDQKVFDEKCFDQKVFDETFFDQKCFDPKFFDPKFFDPKIFDPKFFDPQFFDQKYFDQNFSSKNQFSLINETYSKAIKNLIGVGLVRLTRVGENKQCHRFELLGEDLVPQAQQRWRKYPTQNWYSDAPYRPKNLVGKKTQWEKGQCGNPNFKSHPTKVNGINDKRTTKVSLPNGNGLQNYID